MLAGLYPAAGGFGPSPNTGHGLYQRHLLKEIPRQQRKAQQAKHDPPLQSALQTQRWIHLRLSLSEAAN
jgi:hypothetical protein